MSKEIIQAPVPVGARPLRLVARNLSELLAASAQRWMAAFQLDRLDGLILTVVLSANLARSRDVAALTHLPDAERRSITTMAIADSMHLAYETVRRRVVGLVGRGLLLPRGDGVIAPQAAVSPTLEALMTSDAAAVRALVRTLASCGHLASCQARLPADDAPIGRAMMDFSVRLMQLFVARYGGIVTGSIWTAVVAANVRHIVADPILARRYATAAQLPPDDVRRPVPIRTIARELRLPYETVRRQVAAMVERGVMVLLPAGALVPAQVIASPEHEALNEFNLAQFERMLAELSRPA